MAYIKLEDALHILDLVITDDSIKHKGKAIRKRLKELPTEDVEKVVRCKDCESCIKFYPAKELNEEAELVYYCRFFKSDRRPTDFCSYGHKKEGAEE